MCFYYQNKYVFEFNTFWTFCWQIELKMNASKTGFVLGNLVDCSSDPENEDDSEVDNIDKDIEH